MHKLLFALVVAFAGLATVAAPSASARDYNCSDFANQKRAQLFFLRHGGPRTDKHGLDGDGNGIACESLPCPCYRKKRLPRPHLDRDCSDFRTQRRAQLFFLRHGPRRDRHRLDVDGDGTACESLPCPCSYEMHYSAARQAKTQQSATGYASSSTRTGWLSLRAKSS